VKRGVKKNKAETERGPELVWSLGGKGRVRGKNWVNLGLGISILSRGKWGSCLKKIILEVRAGAFALVVHGHLNPREFRGLSSTVLVVINDLPQSL